MSPESLPAAADAPQEELQRMSLIEHLHELRKRILWSLAFTALMFFPCWAKVEVIFEFLQRPIKALLPPGKKLAFMGITDPFILYFKVAGLAALFLSSPFVLYQLWRFISPGLYRRERHYVLPFVFFGTLFFLSGGAFAYKIAFPYAARYLLGVGAQFEPVLTIERYFGFEMGIILGLGLMFELPIVIFTVCEIGLVTPGFLIRHFRYAVVIIFIIAAILTPTPDIFNMCVFATPTLALYLLGVGAAAVSRQRRARRVAAEAATRS
ncbi:MAG TPA: twin-arginine translocase subunit TatC [Thermoanaerobaculia bacterium]|nr:twin-arginine translocase subunit TatC [Thermoanaerobaculia bacterium]